MMVFRWDIDVEWKLPCVLILLLSRGSRFANKISRLIRMTKGKDCGCFPHSLRDDAKHISNIQRKTALVSRSGWTRNCLFISKFIDLQDNTILICCCCSASNLSPEIIICNEMESPRGIIKQRNQFRGSVSLPPPNKYLWRCNYTHDMRCVSPFWLEFHAHLVTHRVVSVSPVEVMRHFKCPQKLWFLKRINW